MDLASVLSGEVHVGQHVGLAVIDERTDLRPLHPQLVGDVTQGLARGRTVGLDERLAQGCRDHALLALWHVGQGVAHPMHAAALPGCARDPPDRRLQALVRV